MKRTPLKTDPEKVRAWKDRTRAWLKRKKPMNPVNRERKLKRWRHAYGDKSVWLREVQSACPVTGRTDGLECAHVGRTVLAWGHRRSKNADSTWILMLHRSVHRAYDNFAFTEADMQRRFGWTRADIDERARHWHIAWQREARDG